MTQSNQGAPAPTRQQGAPSLEAGADLATARWVRKLSVSDGGGEELYVAWPVWRRDRLLRQGQWHILDLLLYEALSLRSSPLVLEDGTTAYGCYVTDADLQESLPGGNPRLSSSTGLRDWGKSSLPAARLRLRLRGILGYSRIRHWGGSRSLVEEPPLWFFVPGGESRYDAALGEGTPSQRALADSIVTVREAGDDRLPSSASALVTSSRGNEPSSASTLVTASRGNEPSSASTLVTASRGNEGDAPWSLVTSSRGNDAIPPKSAESVVPASRDSYPRDAGTPSVPSFLPSGGSDHVTIPPVDNASLVRADITARGGMAAVQADAVERLSHAGFKGAHSWVAFLGWRAAAVARALETLRPQAQQKGASVAAFLRADLDPSGPRAWSDEEVASVVLTGAPAPGPRAGAPTPPLVGAALESGLERDLRGWALTGDRSLVSDAVDPGMLDRVEREVEDAGERAAAVLAAMREGRAGAPAPAAPVHAAPVAGERQLPRAERQQRPVDEAARAVVALPPSAAWWQRVAVTVEGDPTMPSRLTQAWAAACACRAELGGVDRCRVVALGLVEYLVGESSAVWGATLELAAQGDAAQLRDVLVRDGRWMLRDDG